MTIVYVKAILFFFNDTATTEIYTLSLHDALPIWRAHSDLHQRRSRTLRHRPLRSRARRATRGESMTAIQKKPDNPDRKSTRLNSSHANISYAVFCLKKKKLSTFTSTSFN